MSSFKSYVSAVFKKGQRYDPANYRPVSLTCLCCNMLDHIIVSSALNHVDNHRILSHCQHSFRARRSCITQLVTLLHDLASSLDRGTQTDMVILDFSKAFDRVPHQRLLNTYHSIKVVIYKVVNDLIDIPAPEYLIPSTIRTRSAPSKKHRQFSPSTDSFKFIFFPRTFPLWNSLPATVAETPSLVSFKKGLSILLF